MIINENSCYFPYREEYLAFEIIKSLLKFDAEIYCSKNIKYIKFILESNSQNHNIGTSVLDYCKIPNDSNKLSYTYSTKMEYIKSISFQGRSEYN